MTDLDKFLAERNVALAGLDIEWARKQFPQATSNEVLLCSLHKARYECLQIQKELRHASGEWLRDHGMRRLTGEDLLPEGELPT